MAPVYLANTINHCGTNMLTKTQKTDYDANNPEHRQLYYHFVKKQTWHTPPPFRVKPPYTNLPQQLHSETLQYYLDHEFEKYSN
jgi:hypothetical protein